MDRKTIDAVAALGFDVYMRDPADTWLYFSDGERLGYLQDVRGTISVNTVHRPNTTTGTGLRVTMPEGPLTHEGLEQAFSTAPDWVCSKDRASVRKWASPAEFLKADSYKAGYQLIAKGAENV